jgi:hypothetical protein
MGNEVFQELCMCAATKGIDSAVRGKEQRKWQDHELPWYEMNTQIASQSARLHNEIVELTMLLQPTEEEDMQREQAKKLLEDVVKEIYPDASLQVCQLCTLNVLQVIVCKVFSCEQLSARHPAVPIVRPEWLVAARWSTGCFVAAAQQKATAASLGAKDL